ncbi:MAG: glycosyltransferase [Candidatus Hydrogenedentes bacterium]|nr:glycosyltransferase [Candidatus Hydrogenedentota bacterium]
MRPGVVVIGRNEGERLRRCLMSVHGQTACTVYVDSGSADGSVHLARGLGAEIVELDPARPFCAARARNEGFDRLQQLLPDLAYVQFIDGDCKLFDGWLDRAAATLDARPDVAVVAGRLREINRAASIYNRLCDIEWDNPPGEVSEVGGIAVVRAQAFRDAGGFDATLIAGEEPELCLRLRQRGWKILRLGDDMAGHDAAMTRFSQWWRRAVRSGQAFAEGAWQHGSEPARYRVHETSSIGFWGAGLPAGIGIASFLVHPAALILLAGYPLLGARIYRHMRRRTFRPGDSMTYAAFCTLAKFPQVIGVGRFHYGRLTGKRRTIIEYK